VTVAATPPPDLAALEQRLDLQAELITTSPIPVLAASTTCSDVGDFARELLLPRRISLLPGLEFGLSAIGHALRWQERRARAARAPTDGRGEARRARPEWLCQQSAGAWPETAGRRLLAEVGVPTVPAEVAHSADEAVLAAERVGYPVALKVCGAGLAHKSDIGGVILDLASAAAVREAYARIEQATAAVTTDGVLVAAMRSGGHELLAGVTIDPTFGPVLAVGLGGIWVETLRDVSLRVLPIERANALEMLGELRAAAVLRGGRGGTPVDLERVADVLFGIAEVAALVGPSLQALEVNPLWCRGEQIEALDVLVVTETSEA